MDASGILLFVLVVFCVLFEKINAGPKLIVVLLDGVRWDSIDDPKLKSFRRIEKTGVRAPYVAPIYPSLSYPNYYSIVTGLNAENHGFVHNHLYDNDTDTFFQSSHHPNFTDPIWWSDAEPIWITTEKNNMSAAVYWWGGGQTRINGYTPTISERERYGPPTPEEREDFLERIDDIVEMFKPSKRFPRDRLSLAMMYYGSVDFQAHHFGPNSKEAKEALYNIDGILDYMLSKLKKAGLDNQVNIMVVSDHGMTDNSKIKFIEIDKFRSLIKYQVSYGTQSMIVPHDNMLDKLYEELKQANLNGIEVYKKENIPERYHLKGSKRTNPILLVANEGFKINKLRDPKENIDSGSGYLGDHGYDFTLVKDMGAIFLATGPNFQVGRKTDPLNITDLYNVMCSVLNIEPLPNNGSWDKVKQILKMKNSPSSFTHIPSSASTHLLLNYIYAIISLLITLAYLEIQLK